MQFVKDVAPFELMKIRILNGGHATIAYPAGLMDIHFVHEAMQEPLVRDFLAKLEQEEIIPTVPPVPGVVLEDYYQLIEQRFSNPKIGDTVRRLCLDGSNRQPKFIIPTIADRLKAGKGRCRPRAGIGAVVPLLLRHDRLRRRDRTQRPELGAAAGDGEGGEGRSRRLARHGRHLWRGRQVARSLPMLSPRNLKTLWEIGTRADADALPLRHALTGEHRRKESDGFRFERSAARAIAREGGRCPLTQHRSELVIFDCDGVLVDSEPISIDVLLGADRRGRRRGQRGDRL